MLDLRYAEWLPNRFGGSESKWTMEYEGKLYMVKFPDPNRSPKQTTLSYINNHYSEYIGCHIFQTLGFDSQLCIEGHCAAHSLPYRRMGLCAPAFPSSSMAIVRRCRPPHENCFRWIDLSSPQRCRMPRCREHPSADPADSRCTCILPCFHPPFHVLVISYRKMMLAVNEWASIDHDTSAYLSLPLSMHQT